MAKQRVGRAYHLINCLGEEGVPYLPNEIMSGSHSHSYVEMGAPLYAMGGSWLLLPCRVP